jgi:hypothetical protein
MSRPHNPQSQIALMMESIDMPAQGGRPSSNAETPNSLGDSMDGENTEVLPVGSDQQQDDRDDEFTDKELKLAKRFVELIGGADRARAAVDKVDEGEEFLGLLDDEECADGECGPEGGLIARLAGMLPAMPDLPTGKMSMDVSSLYNPSAVGGAM